MDGSDSAAGPIFPQIADDDGGPAGSRPEPQNATGAAASDARQVLGKAMPRARRGPPIREPVPAPLQSGAAVVARAPTTTVSARARSFLPSDVQLPALPSGQARPSRAGWIWFGLSMVMPILIGGIYLFFFAANQYVAEFRFSVRPQESNSSSMAVSGLSAVFGNMTGGVDILDNFTVADYIYSAQVVAGLEKTVDLRKMFSRPTHDWWARFNPRGSFEDLSAYWQHMVYSTYDPATGLAMVRVRAFTPADSYRIATALAALSEKLISNIGQRARDEAVHITEQEVERAERKLDGVRTQLRELRDREGVIDPNNSIVASNIQLADTLRANIAQLETNIVALTKQLHNPNAPTVEEMKAQLQAAEQQLTQVEAQVNKDRGKDPMLSKVVGQFEALDLQRQSAEKIWMGTLANLQAAEAAADSKPLYMSVYAHPQMPQSSTYPNRPVAFAILIVACIIGWGIGALIMNALAERSALMPGG
jgi:capsular polysaccharide transport system permease protein